ncbi:unnamed protein product [Euphydryas editha]|uniref:CCHC-type domain-containing protein n=1 Tax=Euphydryas editha TaxID=104508 RepID=A0AAU9UFP7_EUPED|nr:unnamed protein product [Euphydryas editha]
MEKTEKQKQTEEIIQEEQIGVDSDASLKTIDSVGSNAVKRKRPLTRTSAEVPDSSDTEVEQRAKVKYSSARRGRSHGIGLPEARIVLKPLEAEVTGFEEELRRRAFRKDLSQVVLDFEESSETCSKDPTQMNAEELRAEAGRSVAAIIEVAKKSSNMKGNLIKRIKDSAVELQDIVEVLASRTVADETRRLRADNGLLRREVERLKAEVKAHRREFEEMRGSMASANAASSFNNNVVEEMQAAVVASVGVMLDERMAKIEERLLPAKINRPPLAADKRRDAEAEPSAPTRSSRRKQSKMAQPKKDASMIPAPSTAVTAETTGVREADGGEWVTVAKKKKKAKTYAAAAAAAAPAPKKPQQQRTKEKKKPKLAGPRSPAVLVTLQPEAEGKGVTYCQVLQRAAEKVNLTEMGIKGGLTVRRAATGARLLQLPKGQTPEVAERLAQEMRTALDGVANVVQPTKLVSIRLSGLDDSVTKEMVAAAVARTGRCDVDAVKTGEVRVGPGGMGMVVVRCPIAAAKALSEAGRLLVGWSSARVQVMEQRPLRCYKCMGIGHTRSTCPNAAERDRQCFRCGLEGHLASTCTGALRCAVCADAGRPASHQMGGRDCRPPKTKGRVADGTRTAPRRESRQAPEDAANMSS